MLDHVVINVRDYDSARAFYLHALEPLGLAPVLELDAMCGFGVDGKPELWVAERDEPSAPVHIALRASDRATVDEFHRSALDAGGRDNGAPGLRPDQHEHYYGAFVLDPDGNNIEAVCHLPSEA